MSCWGLDPNPAGDPQIRKQLALNGKQLSCSGVGLDRHTTAAELADNNIVTCLWEVPILPLAPASVSILVPDMDRDGDIVGAPWDDLSGQKPAWRCT